MIDDQSLDELLGLARTPTPRALIERTAARIDTGRRIRAGAAVVASLALIASIAAVVLVGPATPPPTPSEPERTVLAEARPARVQLDGGHLAHRLESLHPNVTILRVYQRPAEDAPLDGPEHSAPEKSTS